MPCIYVFNICNCPPSIFVPLQTCHHFCVLNVCMYANEPKGLKLINKQTNYHMHVVDKTKEQFQS